MKRNVALLLAGALAGAAAVTAVSEAAHAAESKITILYDAFGNDSAMKKDGVSQRSLRSPGSESCSTPAMTARSLPPTLRRRALTSAILISSSYRTATPTTWRA
jgi:hypothetical protein